MILAGKLGWSLCSVGAFIVLTGAMLFFAGEVNAAMLLVIAFISALGPAALAASVLLTVVIAITEWGGPVIFTLGG